jgi:hypothetical protein
MNEHQFKRLCQIIASGFALLAIVYFLTNLHRGVAANVYVYTYNTVTGRVVQRCAGVDCGAL